MSVNLSGLTILIWFSTIKCLACAQDQIWINSPIQYVLSLLYIQLKTILRVDIYFSPNCQTAYPETLGYAPLVVLMLREKWDSALSPSSQSASLQLLIFTLELNIAIYFYKEVGKVWGVLRTEHDPRSPTAVIFTWATVTTSKVKFKIGLWTSVILSWGWGIRSSVLPSCISWLVIYNSFLMTLHLVVSVYTLGS